MSLRKFPALSALLIALMTPAVASDFTDAADALNGIWRGEDFVLRVDTRRAQASIDVMRPFAWDRFLVKEVAGGEVVFTIGADLFEAVVDGDTLTLSGTSFRGERTLVREAGAADGQ